MENGIGSTTETTGDSSKNYVICPRSVVQVASKVSSGCRFRFHPVSGPRRRELITIKLNSSMKNLIYCLFVQDKFIIISQRGREREIRMFSCRQVVDKKQKGGVVALGISIPILSPRRSVQWLHKECPAYLRSCLFRQIRKRLTVGPQDDIPARQLCCFQSVDIRPDT